jgi:hypothetical protein
MRELNRVRALVSLVGAGIVLLPGCFSSDSGAPPDAAIDVGFPLGTPDAAQEAAMADSGRPDAAPLEAAAEAASDDAADDATTEGGPPDAEPMEASGGDDGGGGIPCNTATDCVVTQSCSSSHICITRPNGQQCFGATPAAANAQCTSNVCLNEPGGSANQLCCATACPAQSKDTCGNTGACWYTGGLCETWNNLTPCHTCSGSTLTTSHCDGGNNNAHNPGACAPGGTSAPCPNNMMCANAYSCMAACSVTGTAPAGTSVGCVAGYYCDTVPATPTCSNTPKATNTPCNNNFECMSQTCTGGKCG